MILDWKGKVVTFQVVKVPMTRSVSGAGSGVRAPSSGEYQVVDCNPHFVTLYKLDAQVTMTERLSKIELKMDDEKHRLMLVFTD